MEKRKEDPINGERALFTLKSATEFSPTGDKSCPVLHKVTTDHYWVSLKCEGFPLRICINTKDMLWAWFMQDIKNTDTVAYWSMD